jgi:hypothetical protein
MTDEELKNEAVEYVKENINEYNNIGAKLYHAYLAGAEPREKRIAELEKENAELENANESQYLQIKQMDVLLTNMKSENNALKESYSNSEMNLNLVTARLKQGKRQMRT